MTEGSAATTGSPTLSRLRESVFREVRRWSWVRVQLLTACSRPCRLEVTCCSKAPRVWRRAFSPRRRAGVQHVARRLQFTPDMLPSDVTGTLTLRAGRARLPAGPECSRTSSRRRDQPDAAEDPGGAARSDAGGAGQRRRDRRIRCPSRSSCSRPRTRSSTRGPTRYPKPSSTGSA